eukprot:scaffold3084_cov144-Cylindrotheca_fusiformis.AAC.22
MMPEIGLVYPHLVENPRRYVASGVAKEFQRKDVRPSALPSAIGMEEALPGAASVSSFLLGGVNVVVTTSASIGDPDILCVAMSWTRDALESPVLSELDLSGLNLGPLVAIQAFSGASANRVRMVLVDVQGNILDLMLTEKLVPLSDFQVLASTDYIQEQSIQKHVTGSDLQSTMVAFLNADALIIAFNPFLITVDLASETCHVWSELQCMEDMRSRSSTIGSILTNVGDLLLGKEDEGLDMAPTAALCVASSSISDSFRYCFTLHADATIRKWRLDPSFSCLPQEVVKLGRTSEILPLPSNWSDARNSVCLCARLYKDVYVLAVQIRTDRAMEPLQSDCHLWVFWGHLAADPSANPLELEVPQEAVALVGMDFVPTQSRCTLSVLLESANSTVHLTFPPSNMSIVSSVPILEQTGNLDAIAKKERTRIESLSLASMASDKAQSNEQTSLEQILHELDSMYMKFLFRPMFPRGTGTVLAPSDFCIRRALGKLVHGAASHNEPGTSIELETLRTMHEWRQKENRKVLALVTTPARQARRSITPTNEAEMENTVSSTLSVYDSFVHNPPDDTIENVDDMHIDGQDEGLLERLEQERSVEIESHEKRWRRFLLQVWEEEQLLRIPLSTCWLDSIPVLVIVRAGITTVLPASSPASSGCSKSPFCILDAAATKLLNRIEEDKDMGVQMIVLEQQLTNIVSQAQLAVDPHSLTPLLAELSRLGRWAWASDEDAISDAEHEELEEAASALSASQLVSWIGKIEAAGDSNLPGLTLVSGSTNIPSEGQVTWSQSQVANCQLRHSACHFATVCTDSVRRLQLSRFLLLVDLLEGLHAREAALRAYLHSIAVLWASAQHVPMPSTAFRTRRVNPKLGLDSPNSPPNKRLSFGDDALSILSPASTSTTTAMDVLMIEISQTMDGSRSISSLPAGAALLMGKSYFNIAFLNMGHVVRKASMLPELGALPTPSDNSIPTDYPRLALRLLAPFVALPLPEDAPDVVLSRKETLAECLLIESHSNSFPSTLKALMRKMACDLLVPKSPDDDNPPEQHLIHAAVSALQSIDCRRVPQKSLVQAVSQVIEAGTSIEVNRLCELDTVKDLFAPIASGAIMQVDDEKKSSITLLAHVMLHLSRVMHRLKILERHIGFRGAEEETDNSKTILEFISGAIKEMGTMLPSNMCRRMPEYVNMWSGLFHHSVSAGHWRQAYSACVENPLSERRESNFRRLVRAMVDSGALSELLEMCTQLGSRISMPSTVSEDTKTDECVDLYEIASEILVDAISSDLYTVRATSSEPARLSDYQGALYALHASQKQWRRAAQSMDLRFLNARKALASNTSDFNFNLRSAELRDHLIVDDLVLSTASSINAIQLVKDSAHRFLVSGEYGPYNMIPFEGFEDNSSAAFRVKRIRSPIFEGNSDGSDGGGDRLSRFLSISEMQGRAIRNIALRALFIDKSPSQTYAKDALLRDLDSASSDIEVLFKNGYYRYGLLLSKAWGNNGKALTGSNRPNGQDSFYKSLVHLLRTSLIPISVKPLRSDSRPTIQQLQAALDDAGASEAFSSCIVADRFNRISSLESSVLRAAAHTLIRRITLAFSTAETPVALDVASAMLEHGREKVKLPSWLENFLLGTEVSSPCGLFAKRESGFGVYSGNPSALLTLYMKHGMIAEACNVVTSSLSDHHSGSRELGAPCRLPEKGDIDFVPYQTIDLLFNLIDILLEKRRFSGLKEKEISDCRDQMKSALEKHFNLLNTSEMGLKSARTLRA